MRNATGTSPFGLRLECTAALIAILFVNASGAGPAQSTPSPSDQASAPLPSFEVVSIKPDRSGWGGMNSTPPTLGSHWSATNVTTKWLIIGAYNVDAFSISGAPDWVNKNRYDVEADMDEAEVQRIRKLPREDQSQELALMLRSLLLDRFKLKVTHVTKELPTYDIILAKDASKLTALSTEPFPNQPHGLTTAAIGNEGQRFVEMKKADISNLAKALTNVLAMPVIDKTGASGNYTLTLRWTDASDLPGGATPSPDYDHSLAAALQEQLGLKLESTKAPRDTINIDHIEEPTAN